MSRAILMTSDTGTFLIETDESVQLPPNTTFKVSRPEASEFENVVDLGNILPDFGEVKKAIVTCCNELYGVIESISNPEKVSIEFGIKLAGESGFPMLTKASGEANFKISVEWKRPTIPSTGA